MTEKHPFDELIGNVPPEEFEAKAPAIEVVEEIKSEVPVVEALDSAPPVNKEETVFEATASSIQEVKTPESENSEKGWFGRSKDAIVRGSENFLKRIGVGALEMFDKNVTSRLSAGPKRQMDRYQAQIEKSEKAMAALSDLMKNTPEGFSNEKGQKALKKFEERRDSSKRNLEISSEKLNTRNKWHESVLNTRNEFLKSIAANYATEEASEKEKLLPLEQTKADCESARLNLEKRNEERDADIARCHDKIDTFKKAMQGAGFSDSDISAMPALKEVLKTITKIEEAKVDEEKELKKREEKNTTRLTKQSGKFDKISKKRKDCENSISGNNNDESEVLENKENTAEDIKVNTSESVETNESLPLFTVKEQVDMWNKITDNDPSFAMNTTEIAAVLFKTEDQLLTKKDFASLAKTFFSSRAFHPAQISAMCDKFENSK